MSHNKRIFTTCFYLFFLSFLFLALPLNGQCTSKQIQYDLKSVNKDFLPTPDTIHTWHEKKDTLGATYAGNPAWKSYMEFLEKNFRDRGLVDIKKDAFTYPRWFSSDDRNSGDWALTVDGNDISVASYWAYSGSTPPAGISAPMIYYDHKNPPASIEGKIVVFDIPSLPDPLPPMFQNPNGEFFSPPEPSPKEVFNLIQWYQVNYGSRFGKFHKILKEGKAAGALQILDMGTKRAEGIYTFPLRHFEFGVPGLYLDRNAGKLVKQAASEGRTATLKLLAKRETAGTYFLSGILPGKNYGKDSCEMVLISSHTDGPNISQENGALGILAMIEYFSHIPQDQRSRSLLVVLDPQHYMPGGHNVDWYALNKETASKIVASIGVEHLGQIEYTEKGDEFLPTGLPEVTQLFVHDNNRLINLAVNAVKENKLPRALVQCPLRKGQGQWYGMGEIAIKRNIPGFGISGYMSAYWSTAARIDKFDRDLAWKQLAVVVQLTGNLMEADLKDIAVPKK